MPQPVTSQVNSSRAYALARRKALSGSGKAGTQSTSSTAQTAAARSANTSQPRVASATVKAGSASGGSSRAASLARRRAMSTKGKSGVASSDRTRTESIGKQKGGTATEAPMNSGANNAARTDCAKTDCECGCKGKAENAGMSEPNTKTEITPRIAKSRLKRKPKVVIKSDSCRSAALARRKAHSTRGKAGISKNGMSSAQTARASNPDLSSRELARTLRDEKSRRGAAGQKKSEPTGRMRPARKNNPSAAQDAPWKVGASDTSQGQTVTGTMVGRSQSVTGDEASTCRDVTGTEYLGADIFKDFCQAEPSKSVLRTGQSATGLGNSVTGNQVGRSKKVTGDEQGTCKNVTGSEYVGANQSSDFCSTPAPARPPVMSEAQTRQGKSVTGDNVGRSDKVTGDETGASRDLTGTQYIGKGEGSAPAKVKTSQTLSGGSVTGSMVGRSERVTGDEPGSCRNVTGDDYVGQEQYQSFCGETPPKTDRKVGQSSTFNNKSVTGTMTGRATQVTGDEPGTCKTVTGTPYAGMEQYHGFCETGQSEKAAAHMRKNTVMAGAPMTGLQPSVGGKMTGDSKGVCETVSGTPYVGRDQQAESCPAVAADQSSADYPQVLAEAASTDFSVTTPARAAQDDISTLQSVTGSSYEKGGAITGPFGMATGKVTGTEEARFGRPDQVPAPVEQERPEQINNRPVSRITGEGMDAGQKITGDDWDRGDHVTGTEGNSATKRNQTLRGGAHTAMAMSRNRNEDMPLPVSPVTGGSGNTENGALITYSGGARG